MQMTPTLSPQDQFSLIESTDLSSFTDTDPPMPPISFLPLPAASRSADFYQSRCSFPPSTLVVNPDTLLEDIFKSNLQAAATDQGGICCDMPHSMMMPFALPHRVDSLQLVYPRPPLLSPFAARSCYFGGNESEPVHHIFPNNNIMQQSQPPVLFQDCLARYQSMMPCSPPPEKEFRPLTAPALTLPSAAQEMAGKQVCMSFQVPERRKRRSRTSPASTPTPTSPISTTSNPSPSSRLVGKKKKSASTAASKSDARKHQCPDCPSTFTRPHDLKRHSYKHSGTRPFVCQRDPHCTKSFSRFDALKRHSSSAHAHGGR